MDPTIIPWVVIFFIVIIVAGYAYGKKRSEALRTFARRRGLSFSPSANAGIHEEVKGFQLFSDTTEKMFSNLINGDMNGTQLMMFDYRSTTGSGRSASTNSQSVFIVRSARLDLPAFEMYPNDIFHRFRGVMGNQNISFPSSGGFSNAYILRSDDEEAVRKAFTAVVLSYFENHMGLSVEIKGKRLLYYRKGELMRPDQMRSFLSQGLEILRLFE